MGSDPVTELLISKRSNRRLVVEVERLAEVALFLITLVRAGARVSQHGRRDRISIRAV